MALSGAPLLVVRDLAKAHGRRRVLSGVELAVLPGELVAVTGENGSGKSTLLGCVAGTLAPDAGTVEVVGSLGFCPQQPLVFERLTVAENFAYFAAAYGLRTWHDGVRDLLRRFRFERWERSLVAEVSGGTRQKLNLALALLHDPAVLLLDEPYAGFDWETYLEFWQYARELRSRGRALVVVSHFVHERERFDRVCELAEGRLRCV